MDTETLIALVCSLLDGPKPDNSAILDALIESNGEYEIAASRLNKSRKRKREDLDGWLTPSASPSKLTTRSPSPRKKPASATAVVSRTRSPIKPVANLLTVLRPPPSKPSVLPRKPPLLLPTPALIAHHTPLTLHPTVLPPELAYRLFYVLLHEARGWSRNKWWLFDRLVESPHRTSFFARRKSSGGGEWDEAARYWYNGRMTDPPPGFLPEMEEACEIVEDVVDSEMRKRTRFPMEWGGVVNGDTRGGKLWRANVAAVNCYAGGKEGVGFHSDQLTYLGPYATIASLSLGTRRTFSLREVVPSGEKDTRRPQTFNIPLPHNSLTIMHASTQEKYKHSIPPQSTIDIFRPVYQPPESPSSSTVSASSPSVSPAIDPTTARINITFRFYRPDFAPSSIPRCECGVPSVLRPDMRGRGVSTEAGVAPSSDVTSSSSKRGAGGGDEVGKYWWACHAGAQNEGRGCTFWRVMDYVGEGRGKLAAWKDPEGEEESH